MRRNSQFTFLIFFVVIILLLVNLNKFIKSNKYNNKLYYSKLDSSNLVKQPIDVIYEELNFNIDLIGKNVKKIHFINSAIIKFKLNKKIDTIKFNLAESWNVSCDSIKTNFSRNNNLIIIPTADIPQKNEIYSLKFFYDGFPVKYHDWSQGVIYEKIYDDNYKKVKSFRLSTLNPSFGAQTWFLCNDSPSDKIDTLKINISVPDSLVAIANGKLIKKTVVNKTANYSYLNEYPIPTYLVSIFVAKYKKMEFTFNSKYAYQMPVQFWFINTKDSVELEFLSKRIVFILNFFEQILGEYPFKKDGLKIVKHFTNIGMENQNSIGVPQIDPAFELLYVHEIIHQWVGDKITSNFEDVWLNEGLTTYLTGLYIRKNIGENEFYDYMNSRKMKDNKSLIIKNIFNPDSLYSKNVYNKGAWVMYQIHQILGNKFYEFLNIWLQQDVNKNYSTDDFFTILSNNYKFNWNAFKHYLVINGHVPTYIVFNENGRNYVKLAEFEFENHFIILNYNNQKTIKEIKPKERIEILVNEKYDAANVLKDNYCELKF